MINPREVIAVPAEIEPLVRQIRLRMRPEAIWLFGSRARGDNRPESDWDILVELPDDADPGLRDPLVGWRMQRELGLPATIVTATTSELAEGWGSVNTLGFEIARDGLLLNG